MLSDGMVELSLKIMQIRCRALKHIQELHTRGLTLPVTIIASTITHTC